MIKIINTAKKMQKYADELRAEGKKIALIPTMGFLHAGHLSLIEEGCRHGNEIIVSIFVNPTQFAPGEDLESYPKSFEKDCELAEQSGATIIFAPDKNDLYGENYQTYISLDHLPKHLCGISRPTHFRGVATIVTKLFLITKPHTAVFGQKDFQQLQVIKQMVKDLNFDIKIIGAPIVREPDGLAMSSRNSYLTSEQRKQALCLSQSLKKALELVESGIYDASQIIEQVLKIILVHSETKIDYIAICDPVTLSDVKIIKAPVLMALAVKIGNTRLIDNVIINP